MTNLFDTLEKRSQAVEDFRTLQAHPGWHLVAQILDANIKEWESVILDSDEEVDKEKIKEAKGKRLVAIKVRNLPEQMMKDLVDIQGESKNYDPFE